MKGDKGSKMVGVPMVSGLLRLWFDVTYVEPDRTRWAIDNGRRLVISPERTGEPHLFRFVFKADPTSPVIVGSVKDLFQASARYRQELNYTENRLMRRAMGECLDDKAHLLDRPDSPIQRPTHPLFPYLKLFIDHDTSFRINLQRRPRLRTDKALYACVAFLLTAVGANPSDQLDLFCLSCDVTPLPRVRDTWFSSERFISDAVSSNVANLYYVMWARLNEAMEQLKAA